ncbi:MAG: YggS family pyridoxal phosphate enzyme [Bacteroidetes bacterium GWA2_30_7]|nr:MAG: YggS family pyridoxal phosphate enzyme [Bacteroidetes bacterium GWA2_30_7]
MNIVENLKNLKKNLPENVKLVAVTKTHPIEKILEIYNSGYKIFGENKVQELVQKYESLPKDIEWHMIGHLQTNKVKLIAPFVSLIHSVDSLKLLKEINKEAIRNNRIIDVLLEIYIATENTKFGLSQEEASEILKSNEFKLLTNIQICGVMGMASYTENTSIIKDEFENLKNIFLYLKENFFNEIAHFKDISMGMSNDFQIAIDAGSTIIRVGSLIFGERDYSK